MVLAALVIFLAFVILDPWKVIKSPGLLPEKKSGTDDIPTPIPGRPDFSKITIKGRLKPIHNASVKEIRKDGLIFMADEGLVKASFRDLEPEFVKYYLYIAALRQKKSAAASAMLTSEPRQAIPDMNRIPAMGPITDSPRS